VLLVGEDFVKKMENLALDHLSLISAYLTSEEVVKLYGCGNMKLNACLRQATQHLKIEVRRLTRVKWPLFISHFPRLVSLIISTPTAYRYSFSDVELNSLPMTLEKLVLDFERGFDWILQDLSDWPLDKDLPLKLRPSRNLANIVPNLKHLEWRKKTKADSNKGQNEFLQSLPRSLEWLELHNLCYMDPSCLQYMPPNLTHLSLALVSKKTNPDTPTEIEPILGSQSELDVEPNDMSTVEMEGDTSASERLWQFPPFLTHLRLHVNLYHYGLSILDALPQCLLKLRLEDAELQQAAVEKLPKSLTFLDCRLARLTASEASSLPPFLETFKFDAKVYQKNAVGCLPRTLTRYDDRCRSLRDIGGPYGNNGNRGQYGGDRGEGEMQETNMPTFEVLEDLPSGLKEMSSWPFSAGSWDEWKRLPRQLVQSKKVVELRGYSFSEHELVANLPRSLRDIVVYAPTKVIMQNLPWSVTSLMLGDSLQVVVHPSWLNHMPNLTSLDCRPGVRVNVADFQNFEGRQLKRLCLQRSFHFPLLDLSLPCFQNLHTLSIQPSFDQPKNQTGAPEDVNQNSGNSGNSGNPENPENVEPSSDNGYASNGIASLAWIKETKARHEWLSLLPKSLTKFEHLALASSSLISCLPPSIVHLSFHVSLDLIAESSAFEKRGNMNGEPTRKGEEASSSDPSASDPLAPSSSSSDQDLPSSSSSSGDLHSQSDSNFYPLAMMLSQLPPSLSYLNLGKVETEQIPKEFRASLDSILKIPRHVIDSLPATLHTVCCSSERAISRAMRDIKLARRYIHSNM
jgi:hypothetical protein